jgi:hypothetical protein
MLDCMKTPVSEVMATRAELKHQRKSVFDMSVEMGIAESTLLVGSVVSQRSQRTRLWRLAAFLSVRDLLPILKIN